MALPYNLIAKIIRHCNRDLVPDPKFNPKTTYHSDWFQAYFQFLKMPKEAEHLGDAFYQARFIYKIMNALHLPLAKQHGFVKFQIIQYASDFKTKFSVEKGIISKSMKERLDTLYDQRNNVHILKAVSREYIPLLGEAKEAFLLMNDFVLEVKQFYTIMESRKKVN